MDIDRILEFSKIKEKLAACCCTEAARTRARALEPFLSESDVLTQLRETSEARVLLEKGGNPPITEMQDMAEYVTIAKQGGCLTAEQLEQTAAVLTGVSRLQGYLQKMKQHQVGLAYYDENLDPLDDIREEIQHQIRNGKVDDYATKTLRSLREEMERTEQKMREKADNILRVNKECMSDNFSTFRNGHLCVPVKKDYKFKINGSVIDKSSTGNTLFIEPTAVAKYFETLQLLKVDEENEVLRILYSLTGLLADTAEIMEQNRLMVEKLDYIFAKGKISIEYDGVEPAITRERKIILEDGRHPLMDKHENVPLNFHIGDGINGIVITGPNTGGKTVAIKTVALCCLMAQCGLHVAAKKACVCLNNAVLCDIGDGQDMSQNLSTFSSHIVSVLEILKKADKDSLVIMDELGSGTDPTEGMGIAIAILQELKKSGALYLVTTHYPEVKNYAAKEEGIINARMTFDKETLKPLYQLIIGEAGESCAFYIAHKLGMPGTMLRNAVKAAYGNDGKDMFTEGEQELRHERGKKIQKRKEFHGNEKLAEKFHMGDSVMIFPDKKIGIVCKPVNEKGVLQVQLRDKKIWISHKRVKLQVAATELYPEDYDFSIVFDSVAVRKARHQMGRKYQEGLQIELPEE